MFALQDPDSLHRNRRSQNSTDHNTDSDLLVTIKTAYDKHTNVGSIIISDNGKGFSPELLETSSNGIKTVFQEHTSTKKKAQDVGYNSYNMTPRVVRKFTLLTLTLTFVPLTLTLTLGLGLVY